MIGNRKYIGIEFEKEYIDLTIKRYNHLTNQNNLFDEAI
jgi:DNA modification methylase